MMRTTTYAEAREALKDRTLRQALYDEGLVVMGGVIVNLNGDEHRERRRVEQRLLQPVTFRWYETDAIPAIIERVLRQRTSVDLVAVARETMMRLSVLVAGVDVSDDQFDHFYGLADRMARAATVVHASGDKAAIIGDGAEALAEFERDYFAPSAAARRAAPRRDILSTLLPLLEHDVLVREVAYYPWVGSHSTSNQCVHLMHHLFGWDRPIPADLSPFVHESLRLHPASPVASRATAAGEPVLIDILAANTDPAVFGGDASRFDPYRLVPEDVPRWGLSFGHGFHACLGRELAAGDTKHDLEGAILVMARALLARAAKPDPEHPARRDVTTTRDVFETYPAVLSRVARVRSQPTAWPRAGATAPGC